MESLPSDGWLYSDLAGDPDMADLVTLFVGEMPERIAEFEMAFADDRRDDLSRLAHQLKGAAGGYGFGPISPLAGALELALRNDRSHEEIAARLAELLSPCRRVRAGASITPKAETDS